MCRFENSWKAPEQIKPTINEQHLTLRPTDPTALLYHGNADTCQTPLPVPRLTTLLSPYVLHVPHTCHHLTLTLHSTALSITSTNTLTPVPCGPRSRCCVLMRHCSPLPSFFSHVARHDNTLPLPTHLFMRKTPSFILKKSGKYDGRRRWPETVRQCFCRADVIVT